MEHGFLDRYSALESPAHRLDPRAKTLLVLTFIIVAVSTPPNRLLAFVVYAGLLSWACALAHLPLSYLALRACAVLPFSVLAAVWLPFVGEGEQVALLGGRLHLSVPGLWLFAGVVMKSLLGAGATLWLISTTPFSSLLSGLRKLGAPVLVVDLLALTYRYIFVLVGEALRLRRGAASRGYRPRWLGQAILIGRLIGRLFLRSYEHSERIYGAMILRGFTGRMPASQPLHFRHRDLLALLILLPALIAARVFLR